ncbi:MAG: DUF2281 domain-containing protein [Chloroherpetonaceae bacterium]|nr:DUF2281 domain-containing protein [Chloroherpetonaceae bacterium]
MDILEEIVAKARTLSPERQREALDFIEFLAKKESNENANAPEPSVWSFSWVGGLKDEKKTAAELKREIRELWLRTD